MQKHRPPVCQYPEKPRLTRFGQTHAEFHVGQIRATDQQDASQRICRSSRVLAVPGHQHPQRAMGQPRRAGGNPQQDATTLRTRFAQSQCLRIRGLLHHMPCQTPSLASPRSYRSAGSLLRNRFRRLPPRT